MRSRPWFSRTGSRAGARLLPAAEDEARPGGDLLGRGVGSEPVHSPRRFGSECADGGADGGPLIVVRGAEQREGGDAELRGQVSGTAIHADEHTGLLEHGGKLIELPQELPALASE